MKRYWWEHVLVLPHSREDISYRRIERLATDKTRYARNNSGRIHEICNPRHETNLTVNVFEIFSLFEDGLWLNTVLNQAGISDIKKVQELNWSYEWEYREANKIKLLDVVINFKTADENSIVIIEAKNKGKVLGVKDRDVEYYMGIDVFNKYYRKILVFLVDEEKETEIRKQVQEAENIRIFTWQQMCQLQIDLIGSLKVNSKFSMFLKSSIHRMYRDFGLASQSINNTYIEEEVSMDEKVEIKCKTIEMQEKIWEIQ